MITTDINKLDLTENIANKEFVSCLFVHLRGNGQRKMMSAPIDFVRIKMQ